MSTYTNTDIQKMVDDLDKIFRKAIVNSDIEAVSHEKEEIW